MHIHEAHLEWMPTSYIHLSEEQEQKACDFLEVIEDLEDVQNMYTNLA
jgi:transcriptional/translational regulatory protein YebC/TACO1